MDIKKLFLCYHTIFQFMQFTMTGAALGLIFKKGENDA